MSNMQAEWEALMPETRLIIFESFVVGLSLRLMEHLPSEAVIRELDHFTDWLKAEVESN